MLFPFPLTRPPSSLTLSASPPTHRTHTRQIFDRIRRLLDVTLGYFMGKSESRAQLLVLLSRKVDAATVF